MNLLETTLIEKRKREGMQWLVDEPVRQARDIYPRYLVIRGWPEDGYLPTNRARMFSRVIDSRRAQRMRWSRRPSSIQSWTRRAAPGYGWLVNSHGRPNGIRHCLSWPQPARRSACQSSYDRTRWGKKKIERNIQSR